MPAQRNCRPPRPPLQYLRKATDATCNGECIPGSPLRNRSRRHHSTLSVSKRLPFETKPSPSRRSPSVGTISTTATRFSGCGKVQNAAVPRCAHQQRSPAIAGSARAAGANHSFVGSEAAYLDSSSAITYCRLSVGWLTAFPHLEKQHADARERGRDHHTGERQWRNPAVNDQAHGKRHSKHLQKTENQPDKCPSANVCRTRGLATGSVESNSGIRRNRHC